VTVGDIKYEYAFNKTDKKEIKVVIGLKEYLENNTDHYLIFKIKGCASLIKEYAKIKEINIPGSEKSWLDVGAPTLIMFQPIIGYYYRMNITSV
jgi:hypothetical protein